LTCRNSSKLAEFTVNPKDGGALFEGYVYAVDVKISIETVYGAVKRKD
jgi:hypothetical protein